VKNFTLFFDPESTPKQREANMMLHRSISLLTVGCLLASAALAQKTAVQSIEEYRAMLQDGNPADLFEAKGEDLWKQKRGPKNASLEKCDLGKGPGVVKGAFVELPRYFSDTNKVQDLESRLLTCMETLQELNAVEIAKTPFGKGEQNNMTALATWISAESKGMKFNLSQVHPQEKTFYEVGKRLFFQRAGPHDFSCSSCHGQDGHPHSPAGSPQPDQESGRRYWLRGLAGLPRFQRPDVGHAAATERLLPPATFPVSWFWQRCHRGLGVYLGVNSQGSASVAPAIKR
jgi:sulfur-oxidizing protein SoxA